MHEDFIHVPPFELHALTSPWPFSVWGVNMIKNVSSKSSSSHEYILVAIDYFNRGYSLFVGVSHIILLIHRGYSLFVGVWHGNCPAC